MSSCKQTDFVEEAKSQTRLGRLQLMAIAQQQHEEQSRNAL